jgi:hypothetical protein
MLGVGSQNGRHDALLAAHDFFISSLVFDTSLPSNLMQAWQSDKRETWELCCTGGDGCISASHLPQSVGAQIALVLAWAVVDEAAHVALEPPPAVHEAHERVDVCLTSTAAKRPALAEVHHLNHSHSDAQGNRSLTHKLPETDRGSTASTPESTPRSHSDPLCMFRLGQPRNDEVAEGGLNYQQQGPPWCGVERERREEEREVCVLLGNSANSLCPPQTDGLVSLRSSPNREALKLLFSVVPKTEKQARKAIV